MPIPESWIHARCQPAKNIVLRDHNAVFISIPKAAATSLNQAFASLLGLQGNVHFEVEFPTVSKNKIRKRFPNAFVFAFVRNPWDRLLSCFLSKIDPGLETCETFRRGVEFNFWKYGDAFRGDMSFREFVEAVVAIPDRVADIHFASQHLHLTKGDELLVDFTGKFENLQADLETICRRLGLATLRLPHTNRTTHGNSVSRQ